MAQAAVQRAEEPAREGREARLIDALIGGYGQLYSEELGIDLSKNTPSVLFRWLCASLLLSARISTEIGMHAAEALAEAGWTTPSRMADSAWAARVQVLNRAGYARYDESTARMLGETAEKLIADYRGDLRKLRALADCAPSAERRLLKAFKGIGDVGVDIFCREAQIVWEELRPFADKKSMGAARRLGLPAEGHALAACVAPTQFPRLLAALVRVDLADAYDKVRRTANISER